ncbi:MAG: site-2 protease family protein [Microthrixaceae bacterium]
MSTDQERRDEPQPPAPRTGDPAGAEDPQRTGMLGSPAARWSALVVFAGLVVVGAVSGFVGLWFTVLVLVPVLVAMTAAELGAEKVSTWARVAAVGGLVVWLAITGGLPMLLVVATVVAMIFLHELGHYVAARRAGMKATEFFLGFGTKLWSFKRGETEFGIKAIPAGAYVKILGMNNLEEVDPADEARTYRQAPFRSRLGVAVAGSAMHFLLALVLLVVQFSAFGRVDEQQWKVGDLTDGGAAQAAGLQSGDEVTGFDGATVGTFDEFRDQIKSASGTVVVDVVRDGETVAVPVDLIRRSKVIGTVGTDVDILETPDGVFVGPVVDNSRVDRAGLETGQRVVGIAGQPVADLDDVALAVDSVEGGELTLEVQDGPAVGAEELTVDLGSAVGITEPTAFLGVGVDHGLRRESVPVAVGSAFAEFGRGVGASVTGIGTVFNPPRLWSFLSDTVTGSNRTSPTNPHRLNRWRCPPTPVDRPRSSARSYGADLTAEPVEPDRIPDSAQHLHRCVQPDPAAAVRRWSRIHRGVREVPRGGAALGQALHSGHHPDDSGCLRGRHGAGGGRDPRHVSGPHPWCECLAARLPGARATPG